MAFRKSPPREIQQSNSDEWGVPYWWEEETYTKLYGDWDSLHKDKQRWEFLRRDAEYRADYNEHIKNPPAKHTKVIGRSKFTSYSGITASKISTKYSISCPVCPKTKWEDIYNAPSFLRPFRGGRIIYPQDPCPFSEAERLANARSEIEKEMGRLAMQQGEVAEGWYGLKVHIEFDLGYSFEEQLKTAHDNFKQAALDAQHFMDVLATDKNCEYEPKEIGTIKERAAAENTHRPRAIFLLRIYDAVNCGCTDGDILGVLVDKYKVLTRDKVRDNFLFAKKYWQRL